MTIAAAEISFRIGRAALAEGNPAKAAELFRTAIVTERQHNVLRPQMRYLSYYGLSLALAHGPSQHAIQACEVASRRDAFNPDLLFNLSRVYLMAGKTSRAMATLELGLRVAPNHPRLLEAFERVDRREPPPITVISRNHPINKWLGKLRSSVRKRAQRSSRATRVTLHP